MSHSSPALSAAEVYRFFRSLDPTEQAKFDDLREADQQQWMTLAEVAKDLEKSKSQVSRYAAKGRLKTNGRSGKLLRVHVLSVSLFLTEMALKVTRSLIRSGATDEELVHLHEMERCMAQNIRRLTSIMATWPFASLF